jgi:hypothetical protein
MDTFDLKPGTDNGGPFKEIQTSAAGLKISEHLPKLAKFGDQLVLVRSMSTKEGDHGRATFLVRTGYNQTGPVQFPSLGALVSRELGADDAALPSYVAVAPYRAFSPAAFGPGFLGPQYAPLVVGEPSFTGQAQGADAYEQALKVRDLEAADGIGRERADARVELLQGLEKDFQAGHPGTVAHSHQSAYERAVRLMRTEAARAFKLEEEKDAVRDAYGHNLFGQGCLLARRLVEQGVPFVEVSLSGTTPQDFLGWDTHGQNFDRVRQLCGVLDPAWAALMGDLKDRGLLETTLVVWMGEFGRTPQINQARGRDHYPNAWSTVLAGGGVKGGQAVGKTSKDGTAVEERPTSVQDFLATVCVALGIDPMKQNPSNVGRPIRIVEKGANPITEIVGE